MRLPPPPAFLPLVLRRLLRTPGFTLVVLLTLALGIGANTAVFSAVNAVLLRPLPYREGERLVVVDHHYPSLNGLLAGVGAPTLVDVQTRLPAFAAAAVRTAWGPNLTGVGEPERLSGARVSGQYFATLGVAPRLGRALRADEDAPGRERVVVLSDGFWLRRFGGDPSVVGRTLTLDGEPHEVVGVMPPGFRDVQDRSAELWRPLALRPEAFQDAQRTDEYLFLVARLRDGVTLDAARAALRTLAAQLKGAHPTAYPPDWSLAATALRDKGTGGIRPALLVLLAAVGCILLIACANIAGLLLARAASRSRELALRTALGAGRGQLLRLYLAESLVLAAGGGGLGVVVGAVGVRLLSATAGAGALAGEVRLDASVLAFASLVTLATAIVFGVVPVFHRSTVGLRDALAEGARGSAGDRRGQAVRRVLVVSEVAIALVLLAGAGLLLKSFARVQGVDPGYQPRGVLTATLALPAGKYDSPARQRAFLDALLARVRAIPGVTAAGAGSGVPFGPGGGTRTFSVEGFQPPEGQPAPWGDYRLVSPGYFETLRVPLRQGRTFTEQDGPDALRVAVVDEELARRYWPGADPIGKRIAYGTVLDSATGQRTPAWVEVVGVVAHLKSEGLDADPRVQVYRPIRQLPVDFPQLVVRTTGDPERLLPAVRAAVRDVDPAQPVSDVATLDQLLDRSVGTRRLAVALLGTFAALALLLASIGLYGLMAHAVVERTREFGVRMALGAGRGQVLALVLRQGMRLALAGTALGLVGAFALTRLLTSQLFAVEATDPVTFAGSVALLLGVALAALLVPALRATGVEPLRALRQE
jgi:putative ABC transport system permease protein